MSKDLFDTAPAAGQRRRALAVSADEVPALAADLLAGGYRLALAAGADSGEKMHAVYLFVATDPDRRIELRVPLDRDDPHVRSIAAISFAGGRFEREMKDLYGIVPDDHPLPRRLVRHFHWPTGWHPMRHGEPDPAPGFHDVEGVYPFRAVEGSGVFEIPVGPVHAGQIEPGHFRFSVVGETILNLKVRLWFVHKGIEKLFEGKEPADGIALSERISGDESVGHSVAYAMAIEDALGVQVPAEDRRARAILLELERIYNHITDIGALNNDAAHQILENQCFRVREEFLRMNKGLTGSRLLRGAVGIGQTRLRRLPDPDRVDQLVADARESADLGESQSIVRDRWETTSTLSRQQALDLGTLGYVAKASGVVRDARYDHPFVLLPEDTRTTYTNQKGDILARYRTRADELAGSAATIRALVEGRVPDDDPLVTGPGAGATESGDGRRDGTGVGIAECWRGTIVHRVELDSEGRLARVKVVDPSWFNWPALPVALEGDTIVPDFPLANKSFNLSYAGNDL